jgi:alkylation response protein AidB-like acyl-CoA dehydrogenase
MEHLKDPVILDDEQRELQASAHRFAEEVLRPTEIELDRLPPDAVVAPDSPLLRVMAQGSELGYTRMGVPVELGGLGLPPPTRYLVQEELAWGGLGITAAMFLASTHAAAALGSRNPELIEEFALPFLRSKDASIIGCWAITEPDHGSDALTVMRPEMHVKATGQVIARPDGDHWVLKGQKSAWVSNAPIASHAMLNVQLGPEPGLERGGVCLLPLDLPGVSRGRALEKHGVRSLPQGELFFDDVRIPKRYMMVEADGYTAHVESTLTMFNSGVGCVASGLARAAYECARVYAGERVQGGRPIAKHQSVRARLFRMFSLVQAARSLSRQVYVHTSTLMESGQPAPLQNAIASKVFCTQAALEVATLGVQILGGVGLTPEYPAEKFLRDATSLTIADGENAMLAQVAAAML